MEEEQKKEVTVATRGGEREVGEGWSERVVVGRGVTWPKRRPSTSEGEEEKRWRREERVGPEIWIFSRGRSSMGSESPRMDELERERERVLKD